MQFRSLCTPRKIERGTERRIEGERKRKTFQKNSDTESKMRKKNIEKVKQKEK